MKKMNTKQVKKTMFEVFGCLVIAVGFASMFFWGDYHEQKNMEESNKSTIETATPNANELEDGVVEVSAGIPEAPIETRKYFDVPLDHDVQDCIFEECEKYDISPALVVAIIERESDFDPENVGDGGQSIGLMQIQPKWHMQRMIDLGCEILTDPCQNVKVGINYLAEQIDRYDGDVAKAVVAYNRGHFDGEFTDYAVDVLSSAVSLGGEL